MMEIKDFKDRTCVSYLNQIDTLRGIEVEIDHNNMFYINIDDCGPQGAQIQLNKEEIKDLVNFLIGE